MKDYLKALDLIIKSKHLVAFTGAGISVESNIPTFRGRGGIWNKYDPRILDIDYFHNNPEFCWAKIKDMFFSVIDLAEPNFAHYFLAKLEQKNILKSIITQNIDNLHQKAGSLNVHEFHGNTRKLICSSCSKVYNRNSIDIESSVPRCQCGGILKPDFVFFGEGIPDDAYRNSINEINKCDVLLIIGTTGEIMPASLLPYEAKNNGAKVIEINVEETIYTKKITNIFFKEKAGVALKIISEEL